MNMFIIAFEILKVPYAGDGLIPAEADKIVTVPYLSFRKLIHKDTIANTLLTFTAINQSHSLRFVSLTVPCYIIPWHTINPSISPWKCIIASLTWVAKFSGSSKKSCIITRHFPHPIELSQAWSLPNAQTSAPCSTSKLTTWEPISPEAPVTMYRFPQNPS